MTARLLLAAVLGLGGLAVALGLLARQSGPLAYPDARIVLADATPTQLDTVDVGGRVVEASVGGVVTEIDRRGAVWLEADGDAFALLFPDGHGLEVEDYVLATGRLRARGGRRWLRVASWSRIVSEIATQSPFPSEPSP